MDAFEIAVEGEIEIEARLFAIGDNVESGGNLIVDGGNDSVFLQFGAVGLAKLIKVRTGEFEPAGEWVTADDGGPHD